VVLAAWSDDLADGQLLADHLKAADRLYRKSDGKVAALQDRCPHRFAPLHMGKVIHAITFSARITGWSSMRRAPACTTPMAAGTSVAREGAQLSGDREAQGDLDLDGERPADAAKVPDFNVLDNVPQLHSTKRDRITIRAITS